MATAMSATPSATTTNVAEVLWLRSTSAAYDEGSPTRAGVSSGPLNQRYERRTNPPPARPLFEAATASVNPNSETRVEVDTEDRGHSLTIDHGWREVADSVLSWIKDKGL